MLGTAERRKLGKIVGATDGSWLGANVGTMLGEVEGGAEGVCDGPSEGHNVENHDALVGVREGA